MSEKPPKHKTKNKGHQKHRNQRQTKFFASVGVAKRGGGGRGGFHRKQLDPEEAEKYGPREIESNAYRYEIEVDEESLQRDKEAATKEEIKRLTQDLGGASAYFRKAWEKDWDTDQSSELLSKGSIFALDMSQLAHSLEHLSLQERIKANPDTLDAMRTQQPTKETALEQQEEDVIATSASPAVASAKKAIMFENLVNKQKQRRLGDPIEIVPVKYVYREFSNNAAPSSSESKTPSTPATAKVAPPPKQQQEQQPSTQPIKTAPSPATVTTPVQPSSPFIQQREPEPKPSSPAVVSGIKGDNTSKAEIDFLDQLIGGNEKKEIAAPKPSAAPSSTSSIQLKPAPAAATTTTPAASASKKPQEDLDDWLSTIL